MAQFTRNNAWNNGGTLEGNADLLWYAIGVGKMMSRDITDPSSWWYFAAIHGQGPEWAGISAPPTVPALPSAALQGWDQCQHGTWYFPPWHRGYLMALENQLRQDIVSLGGPNTWALPYWNYFGPNRQFDIPPAFNQQNFPATLKNVPAGIPGSANPLFAASRFGPNGDGVVFAPTDAGIAAHPEDPSSDFAFGPVTENCLDDTVYTNSFGGGQTGFAHFDSVTGDLENDPHNIMHSYVGGISADTGENGMMGDPNMASIDPIFYLHHGNIDRMWAVWNLTLKHDNSNDSGWLFGPTTNGQDDFQMPFNGSWWFFAPNDVNDLTKLNYTYDDLSAPKVIPAPQALASRISQLGGAPAPVRPGTVTVTPGKKVELVGATEAPVALKGSGAHVPIRLDTTVRAKVAASLAGASTVAPPDRVYLRLDNVVGTIGGVIAVYLNLPEGAKPSENRQLLAGSIGLFGLRQASAPQGPHGGKGMTFTLDITKAIDSLHLSQSFDLNSLRVSLVPSRAIPESAQITVGRISIYRQGA